MPMLLLAQEATKFDFNRFLDPSILPFVVFIVAIIAGAAVLITKAVVGHLERMEKIRQGMNPDDPNCETNEPLSETKPFSER